MLSVDYELVQIEITKGYNQDNWREDLKECLMKAGLEDLPVVFLFNDSQIVFEVCSCNTHPNMFFSL